MKRQRIAQIVRRGVLTAAVLFGTTLSGTTVADEDGRYRAIVLHEGGAMGQSGSFAPKVFIIDSRDGHMWTWEQKSRLHDSKGNFALGTVLIYQGRVRPGGKMGEVVDQAAVR
jgi:hypothetical protein